VTNREPRASAEVVAESVEAGQWADRVRLVLGVLRVLTVGVVVGAEAGDVQGHAGQDILDVGLVQAAVAGVAQAGASDWGDGAFHAGPEPVDLGPVLALLGPVGVDAGLMDGLRVDRDRAAQVRVECLGALAVQRAVALPSSANMQATAANRIFERDRRSKLDRNIARDRETTEHLTADGWAVPRFWEHESAEDVARRIEAVVLSRRSASGGS
jgi:very-short-patch-repair endonuclease